jgi:uncharacterized glyoxalase superfamily protein PhnB
MADDADAAVEVRFTGLNLICGDADATMAFYALLGITYGEDAVWRSDTGAHHVSGVEVGSTSELEIDSAALGRAYGAGDATTLLSFGVVSREAVDVVHDRIVAAGHPSRIAPHDAFWGARFAIVEDPDGRAVGLLSPRDPDLGGPPPDL